MSANLTVYAMALEAERPLLKGELEQARHLAEADTALGRPTDTFQCRLSRGLRRPWRHGVTASRLLVTRDRRLTAVVQPAS